MNIQEQLRVLLARGVEFVVVGGQAGVLRQAVEFSHDLDILIHATRDNAERVRAAVREIAHRDPDVNLILGRDFQQYVDDASGTGIDVHLKLIALPDYEAGVRNAGDVDFLGVTVPVLELPALYASKRTDRPRDAVHRLAIEARLRRLVLDGRIEPDNIVLACCLDEEVARLPEIAASLPDRARTSAQPLLQTRLLALGVHDAALGDNPHLHPTARALLALDAASTRKARDAARAPGGAAGAGAAGAARRRIPAAGAGVGGGTAGSGEHPRDKLFRRLHAAAPRRSPLYSGERTAGTSPYSIHGSTTCFSPLYSGENASGFGNQADERHARH